ncbi:ATP-binding protein [Kordia sp.]|uniref:ATP-binding protein n=1 Tax=Kordia sp. TaxID=1965332 RepID=UPI003D2CE789
MKTALKTQEGVVKLGTLNELAWVLQKKKDSSGIAFGLQQLQLSKKLKNYPYQVDALNILGRIAKHQQKYKDAEKYLVEATELAKNHSYDHGIGRGFNELGLFYKRQGKTMIAIESFLKSYESFKQQGKNKPLAKVTANLGNLFKEVEAYPESLTYFLESLELRTMLHDTLGLAKVHKYLGELSKDRKNYEEMLHHNLTSKKLYEELKKYKSVFEMNVQVAASYDYLNQDGKSKTTYLETKQMIPEYDIKDASNLYHNFATLYKKMGVLDSALFYYQKAQKIFKSDNDLKRLAVNYNNLGNLHNALNNNGQALSNFNQSLLLQKQVRDSSLLAKTYNALSGFYEKNKDFQKALVYKDSCEQIREQLNKNIKNADRLEANYMRDKQQLEKLKNEAEIATVNAKFTASNERRNTIIISIVLVSIVLLFFVLLRVKKLNQEKKLAELAYEQQKIEAQLAKEQQEKKLEEMLKEQERKAITSMISGQEEERERIAKDLHDRLGSMLSVVKIHYKSVEEDLEKIKNETKSQYEKANQLLDEACETVRKIAHNMVSGTLTKFGLVPALKELKQKIEETKMLQIELLAHGLDNRLDNTTEIQLYRIIQELLNNILKHANATEVTIQLLKREVDLNIMVSDNGNGFDNNNEYEGMGLKSIKARVAEMSGNVLIDSSKGNGTTVTIEIPTMK